ncbi:MAG: hypothetical protein ABI579_00635 [Candidatus Sumerlaeota bacterium]
MFGIRSGFGESCETIRIAYAASIRRGKNWVLPGMLGLLVGIVAILTAIKGMGMPYLIMRVILFDYLIFFFGWICGWSAASRWRNDHEFLEELIVTNQRPAIVGNLLFAGNLAVWFRILVMICVVEIVWGTITSINALNLLDKDLATWLTLFFAGFIPMVITMVILVWFHLETLRIAYWMFAIPALSQVDLRQRAISNLLVTGMYVFLLTAIGSMVTGILGGLGTAFFALFGKAFTVKSVDEATLGFFVGSIPGLLLIIYLKRYIVNLYELAFWRTYMLYCWYGAGETVHPRTYPVALHQHVGPWVAFLQMEEAQTADGEMDTTGITPSRPADAATP